MHKLWFVAALQLGLLFTPPHALGAPKKVDRPKLIVMIVFDQFRADYLMRFENQFLPAKSGSTLGGFRALMDLGAYYPYGEYDIFQSMTGPGHATVLTGSYPYQNGIGLNIWYDTQKNDRVYCVEDSRFDWVGGKKPEPHAGASPQFFSGSTVGDELKNAGYHSKVISIAVKDRAAILMGGYRSDESIWFDMPSKKWVSSEFYFPDKKLPAWVSQLNADFEKALPTLPRLKITGEGTGLSVKDPMNLPYPWSKGSDHAMNEAYKGAQATVWAAERAMNQHQLGTHSNTDLLAISFSTHDYLGHEYGPNSREMEEMTIAEDKLLSRLINSIVKKVPGGVNEVVFAFSADHGIPPNPAWLMTQRVPASRINEDEVAKQIESHLTEKYGKPKGGKWLSFYYDFNYWLSREAQSAKGVSFDELENEARTAMLKVTGVARVLTHGDYTARKIPPAMLGRQFMKTYLPGRHGDLILFPKPFYTLDGDTVNHLTGYAYDRTVPIILMGHKIKPGKYAQKAEVIDIAPTLSFLAGVMPPALSEGRVLAEAIKP